MIFNCDTTNEAAMWTEKKWQIEVSLNSGLMYAYGQTKPGRFDTYILFYFCDSVSL